MPALPSLERKRILVMGGTTGIGRATVALLAQEGARIFTLAGTSPNSTRRSPMRRTRAAASTD